MGCSKFSIHCFCQSFLLTFFLCFSVDNAHRRQSHKILQWESFHRQRSFMNWSSMKTAWMGCSLSETDCSSMGPPWGHQVLPQNLLQWGLSMGSQLPSGASTWFGMGYFMSYRWTVSPLWTSVGCRGTTCISSFSLNISSLIRGTNSRPKKHFLERCCDNFSSYLNNIKLLMQIIEYFDSSCYLEYAF